MEWREKEVLKEAHLSSPSDSGSAPNQFLTEGILVKIEALGHKHCSWV